TGVIGWPEAFPVEPATTFALGEEFFRDRSAPAWPRRLGERAALFEVGAEQIDPALLAGFGSPPPAAAATALATDLWRETLAFYLLRDAPRTRAVFLRLPGLRRVSRRWFGGYAAARLEGEQDPRAVVAAGLVEQY